MASHLRHEVYRRLRQLRCRCHGILNMSAMDSPQAVPQITIVNEKGRSSQAEDVRMIQKAEEFCAESESNKAKTEVSAA